MSKRKNKIKVGVTIGDINGIGPELILKTFSDTRILRFCIPIIYGSAKTLNFYKSQMGLEDVRLHILKEGGKINPDSINVINCWEEELKIEIGKPTPENGPFIFKALEKATQDVNEGKIDALVTAPINKDIIDKTLDSKFVGHTEYLAEKSGGNEPLMVMVSGNMRVAVATGHISVAEVQQKLNAELIVKKLEILQNSLIQDFAITAPTIAILGLNPHAGDNGLLGKEESTIINPAIEKAKDKGIKVFGPYSADGYFGSGMDQKFDAVLAMYHDQGLAPFKAMAFDTGVNFTAGIPIVRTSPDHGPAYDLAGKNTASAESFRSSVFEAIDIARTRKTFKEFNKNPLDRTALTKGMDNKEDKKKDKPKVSEVAE